MSQAEHIGGITAPVGEVGVGKQVADVAEPGRTKQGVGDGVQQDIGIAVADEVLVVGDVDSPQPQRPPLAKAMRIVSDAHAHEVGNPSPACSAPR